MRPLSLLQLWIAITALQYFTVAALSQDVVTAPAQRGSLVSVDNLPAGARFRIGSKCFRPEDPVCELVIAPNEKTIVCLGEQLSVWDSKSGERKWFANPRDHGGCGAGPLFGGQSLAISTDSTTVFSGGGIDEFITWNLETGSPKVVKLSQGFDYIVPFDSNEETYRSKKPTGITVSSDDQWIAICSSHGVLVGTRDGHAIARFANHPTEVIHGKGPLGASRLTIGGHYTSARFSPDNRTMAIVTSDAPDATNTRGHTIFLGG